MIQSSTWPIGREIGWLNVTDMYLVQRRHAELSQAKKTSSDAKRASTTVPGAQDVYWCINKISATAVRTINRLKIRDAPPLHIPDALSAVVSLYPFSVPFPSLFRPFLSFFLSFFLSIFRPFFALFFRHFFVLLFRPCVVPFRLYTITIGNQGPRFGWLTLLQI